MARPELGIKRKCPITGKPFYDLNRDPIVSPYTGESYPRSQFEPKLNVRPTDDEDDDMEPEVAASAAEIVPLEDAEAGDAKDVPVDDIEIEGDVGAEDDTFLEEEEEGGDDVTDLIDGELEQDEES